MAILNEEVRHKRYYEAAQAEEGGAEALEEYRAALHAALAGLREKGVAPTGRTGARGAVVEVEGVVEAGVEKCHVAGRLRRSGVPVELRLRLVTSHYDWEDAHAPEQDDLVASTMQADARVACHTIAYHSMQAATPPRNAHLAPRSPPAPSRGRAGEWRPRAQAAGGRGRLRALGAAGAHAQESGSTA